MYAHLGTQLHKIAEQSMEDLCSLAAAADIDDQHFEAEIETVVRVTFTGDLDGSLVIRSCGELTAIVASNLLVEEDPSEAQHVEALGEIAQAICQRFLPEVSSQEYDLEYSAELLDLEWSAELDDIEATAMAQLPFDGGRIDVMLFLDEDTELHVLDRAS